MSEKLFISFVKYYMKSVLEKIRNSITPDKFINTKIKRDGIMNSLNNNHFTIKSAVGEILGNIRNVTQIYFYTIDNSLVIWWDDGGFTKDDCSAVMNIGDTCGLKTAGNNGLGERNSQPILTDDSVLILSRHKSELKFIAQKGLKEVTCWEDGGENEKAFYKTYSVNNLDGTMRQITLKDDVKKELMKDDMVYLKKIIRTFLCKRLHDNVEVKINDIPVKLTHYLIPDKLSDTNKIKLECEIGKFSGKKDKVLHILNFDFLPPRLKTKLSEYMFLGNIIRKSKKLSELVQIIEPEKIKTFVPIEGTRNISTIANLYNDGVYNDEGKLCINVDDGQIYEHSSEMIDSITKEFGGDEGEQTGAHIISHNTKINVKPLRELIMKRASACGKGGGGGSIGGCNKLIATVEVNNVKKNALHSTPSVKSTLVWTGNGKVLVAFLGIVYKEFLNPQKETSKTKEEILAEKLKKAEQKQKKAEKAVIEAKKASQKDKEEKEEAIKAVQKAKKEKKEAEKDRKDATEAELKAKKEKKKAEKDRNEAKKAELKAIKEKKKAEEEKDRVEEYRKKEEINRLNSEEEVERLTEEVSILENEKYKKQKIKGALRHDVYKRDFKNKLEGNCPVCTGKLSPFVDKFTTLSTGHIIPESKGGPMEIYNLVSMCSSCNARMGTRDLREYLKTNFCEDDESTPRLDKFIQKHSDILKQLKLWEDENNYKWEIIKI